MDSQNTLKFQESESKESESTATIMEEDEKSKFIWTLRPHPLCIPHIVDNILSYLEVQDLKSSRLVNSQYNEIACHNLARKEVITFNKISQLSSYLSLVHNFLSSSSLSKSSLGDQLQFEHQELDMTRSKESGTFLLNHVHCSNDNKCTDNENEMASPTSKTDIKMISSSNLDEVESKIAPTDDDDDKTSNRGSRGRVIPHHTNFRFNFDPELESSGELEDFFDSLGDQIISLHYTTDLIPLNFPKRLPHIGDIWSRLTSIHTISLEIKWGCPPLLFEQLSGIGLLPSVRKLVLDILITEREADRAAVFLRQLLSATPNLQEITIPGSKKYFDDYINVMLGKLILSLELPRLSSLNFCLALNASQIMELAQKNFPLKSLILDFAEINHISLPLWDDENNNDDGLGGHEQGPQGPQGHHRGFFHNQNQLLERSLRNLFAQSASTLKNLHLCFPYNADHPLHRFTFPEPMMKLDYLALGRFYGSVTILDNIPAIKKLDLWNVRFHDFDYGVDVDGGLDGEKGTFAAAAVVPTEYLSITTVIS